jgi:hypothetical protein
MKSLTRKFAIAAAVFATAGVLGANAAGAEQDAQQQAATAALANAPKASHTGRTPKQLANLEFFEQQESILDAPSYDPAEHPDAKPAPHSAHRPPSVWDNPLNTLELN